MQTAVFASIVYCVYSVVEHYIENFGIGLTHTLTGELTDRLYGLFNIVFEYAVAAVQTLAVLIKVKA